MLRPLEEVDEIHARAGRVVPYTDPVLKRSRRTYVRLLRRLHAAGLVRWSRRCRCEVGVFTVSRKDGRLRLILDCRSANRYFLSPPGVSLLTAEGLGRIEVDPNAPSEMDPLAAGIIDVQNCFHRMLFDTDGPISEIAEFFGLPPVTAGELGLASVNGEAVLPEETVPSKGKVAFRRPCRILLKAAYPRPS